MKSAAVLTLFVAWVATQPTDAVAWTDIAPCVAYDRPSEHVHVVRTRLSCSNVRLAGTPEAMTATTTSDFAHATGARVAINANFFDMKTRQPKGVVITEGVPWKSVSTAASWPALECTRDKSCSIDSGEQHAAPPRSPFLVVSGMQSFSDGVFSCTARSVAACDTTNWTQTHPRTAVGLSEDHAVLYFFIVEGRLPSFPGYTIEELAALLRHYGVTTGVNLDGGGSTTLVIDGQRVNQLPERQTEERPVSNHLGVLAN